MPLAPGTQLGPYEIGAPLGAGGMGEVYRARDTRLNRTVAIKILPQQLSSDAVRRQRFEREAKTISGLNHPNICTLHDIGSQDGVDYLVMECVEGETLAKRLEKGPLPLDQVLRYGAQIAEGLHQAHKCGVVHRDLKPGNIMLTVTGAKLLDFGLAKPVSQLVSGMTLTSADPLQSPVTQEGTIVGTFQYMSPEQVEGKEVDGRSDIFALGSVLYEMLTGRPAFPGKSQLSVASAILEKEPEPLGAVKPLTPPALDHVIRKCLAKIPDERWQSASDLASELKWIGESGSAIAAPAVRSKTKGIIAWVPWALCASLAAGALLTWLWWANSTRQQQTMHFYAVLPFAARDMAVSPNGHTVAVVGLNPSTRKNVLLLYELGSHDSSNIANTEGATFPFWSADGKSLGFFADGKLKKIDLLDGTVQTLCDAPTGRGGAWNKDGVIVFTPSGQLDSGLYRISASGGTPVAISTPDSSRSETSHRWPQFLPDGKHFLYFAFNVAGQTDSDGIFMGALDSNEKKLIVKTTANAAYAEPGYLIYYQDNNLLAQRFDSAKLQLTSEPTPILTNVRYLPRIARAVFAAANTGALVAENSSQISLSRLVWYDRKGNEVGSVGKPDTYSNVFLSPNGKQVALDKTEITSQNADVWISDLQGEGSKRITFDSGIDAVPIWSPDGSRIVFSSSRRNSFDLFLKNADGAQEEKIIEHDGSDKYPNDWSKDGKYILYTRGSDLWYVILPEMNSSLFLKSPATFKNGQFSPSGKWLAYASNESGKWEIYVTSFPEAKGKWQVSNGGGEQPRWRGDGQELFYLASDAKLMAVPVKSDAAFDSGAPVALFQANPREIVATSEQILYDVSKDGQKFLINTQVKDEDAKPMSVILNWDAGLKKK